MLELKEQNFVAQKCGENCTCHNHIKQNNSKDIPEATISAHLIRGIELGSVGNVVEKTEIGKQNANVHNFLAHLKYRILGAEKMSRDENLSIFDNPPELLEIHDNGFDKKTEISEDQQAILAQLNELTIGTPADIKTFAEKITQIDCNTGGLDKTINRKLEQIKSIVKKYKEENQNKPLTLNDINTAHKTENEYKKKVKDIIKEGLNINKENKIQNLTEDQVVSLKDSINIKKKLITLNNEYNNIYLAKTDDSLYKTVGSFVINKEPEENISLIKKILNFLGIQVNNNVGVQAVVETRTNNTGTDEEEAALEEKKRQKELEEAALEEKKRQKELEEADALKKQKKDEELKKRQEDAALALEKEHKRQKEAALALEKEQKRQKEAALEEKKRQEDEELKKRQEDAALALEKEQNVPVENNVVENLLQKLDLGNLPSFTKKTQARCADRGTSLKDIIQSNNQIDKKFTSYGNPVDFNGKQTSISLVDLSANIGISYGAGRNNEYSAEYNKRRFDSFSEDDKKYITNNMSLSNKDFSKLFILTTLKTSVDKCKNILNDKSNNGILIADFKTSFDAGLHKKTDQFAAADLLLFLIDKQHKINKDNQGITKDDITKDNLISCIDSISITINTALTELKAHHLKSTETIVKESKQPKIIGQHTRKFNNGNSNAKSNANQDIIKRLKFDSPDNIFSTTNTKTQLAH